MTVIKWILTWYGNQTQLVFGNTTINSSTGFHQGGPLTGLLFAIVLTELSPKINVRCLGWQYHKSLWEYSAYEELIFYFLETRADIWKLLNSGPDTSWAGLELALKSPDVCWASVYWVSQSLAKPKSNIQSSNLAHTSHLGIRWKFHLNFSRNCCWQLMKMKISLESWNSAQVWTLVCI